VALIPLVSYPVMKKSELSVTLSTDCLIINLVAMDKQPCARFENSKAKRFGAAT
jgi:hypothetical protein